ncbi:hypothetical protein [Haloferax sp. DFSO60]|uniref:DUF7344 domain-containing protein n=1 Tax=Haloferax sp. DFSO60 TaxID=3388652 RepID=UPI00397887BF
MSDPWEVVYQALSNSHRRSTLRYLKETDSPTAFDDVVERLVDDGHVSSAPDELARARTKMYHVHLPKLCRANLAEWDGGTEIRPSGFLRRLPREILSPKLTAQAGKPQGADD